MSGTAGPIASRTARTRPMSTAESGCPTLTLMPPMPRASDRLAFSSTSSSEEDRNPPEVL